MRTLDTLPSGAHPDADPGELDTGIPHNWMTTKLDYVVNWARRNSLWPMPFGTACCAIEMMASAASKYDIGRFGMERMSFSPRQADLMIVAGRVTYKLAPVLRRVWDQMPQPKWCVSMGACASSGGMFDNYTIVQGIDTIVPGRRLRPGLPAAAGRAHLRTPHDPGEDQGRVAGRPSRRETRPRRPSDARICPRRRSNSSPSPSATRRTRTA